MHKIFLTFCASLCASTAIFALQISQAEAANRSDASSPNFVKSFNSSIKEAKKSVVSIKAIAPQQHNSQIDEFFNDPFFRHFFQMPAPEANPEDRRFGSGVIISPDGYIITNNHLVAKANKITVNIDEQNLEAKLIGTDEKTDVALIKVDAKGLRAIKFANSDALLEGDLVFAIGNPFGVGESVSAGIISALNKNNIGLNAYEDFIQTDAAINPGNSGGALVDSRGALIGINSAIITRSGGANGIGFAIPANMAREIAEKLASGKSINRGYLGVYLSDLEDDVKKVYDAQKGALITEVLPDSAAAAAGLKRGDLVLSVDNTPVKSLAELRNLIGKKQPGDAAVLKIERDKKTMEVKVTLGNSDSSPAVQSALGLSLRDVEPAQDGSARGGAVVAEVAKDSVAQKAGIRPGDVIIGLNSSDINSVKDFNEALKTARGKYIKIWLARGGMVKIVVLNKEEK